MGQIVPFPASHSASQRPRRFYDRPGRLIPLIPSSRLFVAGMAAQYPAIKQLAERLGAINDPLRPARERIIERLIMLLPSLPAPAGTEAVGRLLDAPFTDLYEAAHLQLGRSREDRHLYALGQSIWRDIEDGRLREFAQRCAVALTEAFHLARQATRTASAA